MQHKLQNLFILYFLVLMGLPNALSAQNENENENAGKVLLFNVSYALQMPGGDLANRFGLSNEFDLNIDLITGKNFILGVRGGFNFGTEVKEDVLALLRDDKGEIIGSNQAVASVVLRQRGQYYGGYVGKIFPLSSTNKRSGIRLTLGMGLLQHKIRVQDDQSSVPQVTGDYKKGYDRLSNGLAVDQFIGYQHMSKNRRVNFYVGFEFVQAFTKNRRDFNFDTRMNDNIQRLDLLYALKIGWTIIPKYLSDKGEEIYY